MPWVILVVVAAVAGFFAWRAPTQGAMASAPSATDDAQHLVSILQYLANDYPAAVASHDEGELKEQRSLVAEAVDKGGRALPGSPLKARIDVVSARVNAGTDGDAVGVECLAIADELVRTMGIARAPSVVPDLEAGARLFAQNCATCHGSEGHGDGPAAAALKPRPADFHSDEVMQGLTPFKAFNVIRFGVNGTAMAPFTGLDEKQRWDLAFYLFTLRQPPCDHAPQSTSSLDVLANHSDEDLRKTSSEADVACSRRKLPELDAPALLASARTRVDEAMHLADHGDFGRAENEVLDAYLSDIEPIEPWLKAHDATLVTELEASFTDTRAALQSRDPRAHEDAAHVLALLDRAAGPHSRATAASVFGLSALVIVREGFEAAVIIAALLAVVKKRKQIARARLVHAGWVSALAVGAIVFVLGRQLLAGAMNEKLEGILAIVATAMLLHAALWLNARSTTRRTMGDLRDRTSGALDRGGLALFGIAFLAMFRESFETAVFLEALSIDAPAAAVWGALVGTALLLVLVVGVGRLGLRLPMVTLFKVSTVVLVVTAVVLLGQGVHSLEEVGVLPSRPMPFFQVDFLGVYPDRLSLLAQLIVAVAPLVWRASSHASAQPPSLDPEPKPGE